MPSPRRREVGVDVEREREIEDAEAIAERCFSPAERDACRALGFLYCWTRKEAFVKALGSGLSSRSRSSMSPPRRRAGGCAASSRARD